MANYSQFLIAWKILVTFINCHIFSPVVWALSNPLHTNKLNIFALLVIFTAALASWLPFK